MNAKYTILPITQDFVCIVIFSILRYFLLLIVHVDEKRTVASSVAASSLVAWASQAAFYRVQRYKRTPFRIMSSVLIGEKGSLIKRNTGAAGVYWYCKY